VVVGVEAERHGGAGEHDDAPHTRLLGQVDHLGRGLRLREQEQLRHAIERGHERRGLEEVALEDLDAFGKSGLRRVAGERPHRIARLQEPVDDVPPDQTRSTGHQDRHDFYSSPLCWSTQGRPNLGHFMTAIGIAP
jgi:hypothetical protein